MSSTKKRILEASKRVLSEDKSNFSMRKVADKASISLGNLQYHYKTRQILLENVLIYLLDGYSEYLKVLSSKGFNANRDTLLELLKQVFSNEQDTDYIEEIFFILSSTDQLTEDIKKEYYDRVSDTIFNFFERISPNTDKNKINFAVSILFPFLDSYPSMNKYLKYPTDKVAVFLVDSIIKILDS